MVDILKMEEPFVLVTRLKVPPPDPLLHLGDEVKISLRADSRLESSRAQEKRSCSTHVVCNVNLKEVSKKCTLSRVPMPLKYTKWQKQV